MNNIRIRKMLLVNNIKNYELADKIGIYPSTLNVWMRTELTGNRLERVEKALDILIAKR